MQNDYRKGHGNGRSPARAALTLTTAFMAASLATGDATAQPAEPQMAEKPNVVLIMTDDQGFSDLSCNGSVIETPNICALAESGVMVSDYYTSPMCAPTRSMLLTGVDSHQAGLGNMPPLMSSNQLGYPGYEGSLNNRVITVAEMLKEGGYDTYMAGKWHLGGTPQSFAHGRGFDRAFEMSGGGISHFADQLPLNAFEGPFFYYSEDGVRLHDLPQDFYSSQYYTDRIIDYIGEAPENPFFAYLAMTAPHDPLQAPDDWIDMYAGRFDQGYDTYREERLARLKEMGLVDGSVQGVSGNAMYPPWEEMTKEEQRRSARAMEIYAAMISNVDHQIGRLVAHLREIGEYDDTIFIYTHDNGGNPKPRSNYGGNVPKFFTQFDDSYENMGRPGSFVSYEAGWAEAGSVPFSLYKTTTGEGGLRVPLIVSGPNIARVGERIAAGNAHVADITPTIIDWAGIARPDERHGKALVPFYGRSMAAFLRGEQERLRTPDEPIAFELNANKMLLRGHHKIRKLGGPEVRSMGGEWQLFDVQADPAEQVDLAGKQPEMLAELVALFDEYAAAVGLVEKAPGFPAMFHRQTWSIREGMFSDNPMAPQQPR